MRGPQSAKKLKTAYEVLRERYSALAAYKADEIANGGKEQTPFAHRSVLKQSEIEFQGQLHYSRIARQRSDSPDGAAVNVSLG
jgi:hypothetical protein